MAEDFLREHPNLRGFVLSDVVATGAEVGRGAYGRIEAVTVPVGAVAKTVYSIFQEGGAGGEVKASADFVKECYLLSSLRHPNIVQFLGITFIPGSPLPALVMERMLTSLHDLLAPDTPPPPDAPAPMAFFTLALKCSVLHNLASGLNYLHGLERPIIHRDLSARNVLISAEVVAKIADLGMARFVPGTKAALTMTKGPGNSVYMPPEASESAKSNKLKSKYDASIDVFSFGVVAMFVIGETFPSDPLAATYPDINGKLVARTELERRNEYMECVYSKLNQHSSENPIILLIQNSLDNIPDRRPAVSQLLELLNRAMDEIRDGASERNKCELVRALQTQSQNQVRELPKCKYLQTENVAFSP